MVQAELGFSNLLIRHVAERPGHDLRYNFRREDTRTSSGDESPRQSTEKVLFIWLSFPMVV